MIKGISITNFKGIGDPGISLDLGPVTLLFGSNSAGKSTIFHAFLYAYEVLVNRNYNVDRTILGGKNVDLGGFQNFVHNHDPGRTVVIKVDLDMASARFDKDWRIPETLFGKDKNEVDLSALGNDVWSASVEFKTKWNKKQGVFVSAFKVWIDDDLLISTWFEEQDKQAMSEINYRHTVFQWPNAEGLDERRAAGVLDELYKPFQTVSDQRFWVEAQEIDLEELEADKEQDDVKKKWYFGEIPDLKADFTYRRVIQDVSDGYSVNYYFFYDNAKQKAVLEGAIYSPSDGNWDERNAVADWSNNKKLEEKDARLPIRLLEQEDALPKFDRPLQLLLAPALEAETRELIRDVVSRLALGPVKLLANELSQFRHIGPLREVPSRNFQETLSPDPARWCSGLAAWDKLSQSPDEFVEKVSDWLSSDQKLGTGYSLARKRFRELEPDGFIMRILEKENPLDDLPLALEGIEDLEVKSRLVFRDEESGTLVELPDIAVGLTQVVPVVVAAVDNHDGVTLVEQPELHNHPSVEVGLGDLLIATTMTEKTSRRFIVETHGEHLLLRILKRIRQTTEKVKDNPSPLAANNICIYFIEKSSEGTTQARRIEVDIHGDFIQPWPDDFFEIDFKERID